MKFQTYNDFLKSQFKKSKFYKTFEQFKKYREKQELEKWLETLRGIELTENQAYSIISTYRNKFDQPLEQLPRILVLLERQYDIKSPVVEGIFTIDYWENRLNIGSFEK